MTKNSAIRTFELVQYTTAPIPCETMDDLPNNLQDQVYEALERASKKIELPLCIVAVESSIDYGETEDEDRPYLRVIASEVVMADERDVWYMTDDPLARFTQDVDKRKLD